jgi:uncharacterized SAM-binding protein YcdF (DUF218 family)
MRQFLKKMNAWFCGLFLVSLLSLGVLSVLAGAIYEFKDTVEIEHLPDVDAIVCLAGGRGRITTAADIWYQYFLQGRAPLLYLSGVGHQVSWSILKKQIRPEVLRVIQPKEVTLETQSSNTVGNAQHLLTVAQEKNFKKILLITSSYHMKRSRFIFERLLGSGHTPIQVETLSLSQEPLVLGQWWKSLPGLRVTLGEYLKGLYYRYLWPR